MASAPHSGSSNSAPAGYTSAKRTPTNSSYYDFNGTPYEKNNPDSATWMYARDARAQQAGLPPGHVPGRRGYPSIFSNGEPLELSTPGSVLTPGKPNQWLHHPLIPGTTKTWDRREGVRPGAVRSAYTAEDPNKFDVMYHEPKAGLSARGHGRFVLAPYSPAAEGQRGPN